MEKLPLDILSLIATKLPCESLIGCALVSKAWHRTFTQPSLFRRLAIDLGAPRDAAADHCKEWRRIWWHARRIVVWPGKRQLTDANVSAFLANRSQRAPLELALIDPFHGAQAATAAALLDLCVSLTGSSDMIYDIPPTPQGLCAGMPASGFSVKLPRFQASVDLYRSKIDNDIGCYDIYTRRGHLFCTIGVGDLIFASEKKKQDEDELLLLSCLLEVRPCEMQPSTRMQEQAKRHHYPFISLVSPVTKADTLWALELMAEWAAQCNGAPLTRSPHSEKSDGCVVC